MRTIGACLLTYGALSMVEAFFGRPAAFAAGLIILGFCFYAWRASKPSSEA